MFDRVLMASAVLCAGVAIVPPAQAQYYPPPPGYTQPLQPVDRAPDFDALDEDDRGGVSLSPPGYQQQPNYAPQQQTYQQQPALDPRGPVMSPDDPRYGRPQIYQGQAAPQQPQQLAPQPLPQQASQDPNAPLRPPGAIDGPTGAVQQGTAMGANGRSVMAALPPEDQPETGPRKELPERLRRQEVSYQTKEPAGTIIVDTPNTQLYYILGNGRAIRYGVRVGRDGFTWNGVQKITRKAEWPDWHPPTEMIERQPYLPRFMAGGDGNPLGARAMYLGNTVYRIHGTNQPSTIGQFVSSGCIGMLNEDVTDLFERTKVGTRVVVLPGGKPPEAPVTASAAPAPGAPYTPANDVPAYNYNNAPRPNAVAVPNQPPAAVPPLPAPVVIR